MWGADKYRGTIIRAYGWEDGSYKDQSPDLVIEESARRWSRGEPVFKFPVEETDGE